ncbi:TATA element modulatory factor [Ixodes scapularis]
MATFCYDCTPGDCYFPPAAVVPNADPEQPAAVDASGSESPLVIDFPNYASLEQSAESDGSTDTLLGVSLPGSSSSSNQSRESFSDWQDSTKESRDRGAVVVREPEHATDVGFPSRQSADDGGLTEPVASERSDVVDGAIVKPPEATSRRSTESSSTQVEAPVHKSDEVGVHNFFVVVDSTTAVEEAKALREDPHASGAGDGWSESVCSRLGDESGDEVKAGDEVELCDSGSKTPVTGNPPKEDVDLQSVAGSLQSVDTSSSASFVRISAEETEDSRKSSSPSGDEEGETVSSSDIEIISSPNGGSSCDQFSGVLPARHLWEMRRESREEKRSESPETVEDSHNPLASALESSPSRLGEHMSEEEKLRARVNELQGVLDARERKVFLLSKEIAEMSDSNAALQSSLRQAEELRSKESQDVSRLTQEFTHRLAKLETRLLDTSRERDTLKSRLEAVQQESVTKVSISQMDVLLKEKDEQIAELMSEGKWCPLLPCEKLSKQHLQQSTIIKKLRAKEKDMENVIKSHKERLEDQSKELDRLRRSMSAKDDQEKKHIDTIRQLTSSNHQLEKDAKDLEESLADAHVNLAGAMAKLDNAYSEIAELRHVNSECETRAEEATLSAKMAAGEEIRRAMEQTKLEAAAERTTLLQRIEELQMALTVADQRAERREDVLRINVRELQQQLQEAEVRNQEITQNLSSATRPLLRQIENLQSTFSVQSASWERVEKSLTDRLNEAQTHATLLAERERSLGEKCSDLQLRATSLETQNAALRREKQELAAEVQELRERQRDLDESERREATFEAIKTRLEQSLKTLRTEKEELSTQLRAVQEELESEVHKTTLLEGQLRAEREKRRESSATPSPTVSQYSSVSDTFNCNVSTAARFYSQVQFQFGTISLTRSVCSCLLH